MIVKTNHGELHIQSLDESLAALNLTSRVIVEQYLLEHESESEIEFTRKRGLSGKTKIKWKFIIEKGHDNSLVFFPSVLVNQELLVETEDENGNSKQEKVYLPDCEVKLEKGDLNKFPLAIYPTELWMDFGNKPYCYFKVD